jgi:Mn2+/Fe2+ NRAMP family transporter
MSLALQLVIPLPYLAWVPVAAILLGVILWKASFDLLENGSAIFGLAMLVTVAAMIKLAPPWSETARQLIHPVIPGDRVVAYLFAGLSLLGSYMTPYQFFFYSSGAVEEEWSGPDLVINRVTSIVGSFFGAIIDFALFVVAGVVLFPRHAQVQTLADAAVPIATSLGSIGLALFILGAFAVSMGAGLETALSGAYAACQYMGWDWGKQGRPSEAPLFSLGYLIMLVAAVALAFTRVDPVQITIITLALAAATLPFTFIPLLIIANDRDYVGDQRNTRAINAAALLIIGLLLVVTFAALPLLVATGG